jgi:hypothetical protein
MTVIYYLVVSLLVVLSFCAQEFVPLFEFAQQARVLLPPAFFFSASLSVSFPVMLAFALFTGLVWDARHLPYAHEKMKSSEYSEMGTSGPAIELHAATGGSLPLGYTAILFAGLGTLMQGIRPLFRRGRWELPVIMVGLATFTWLLVEYLLMSFLRGSFVFPALMWTKLVTDALLATLAAPLLLFTLHSLARWLNFEQPREGFTFRFHGG